MSANVRRESPVNVSDREEFVAENIVFLHCGAKKLHHFIFAITLSNRIIVKKLFAHIYSNKFGTKRDEKHQSPLKHIFTVLCETQHACACSLPTSPR